MTCNNITNGVIRHRVTSFNDNYTAQLLTACVLEPYHAAWLADIQKDQGIKQPLALPQLLQHVQKTLQARYLDASVLAANTNDPADKNRTYEFLSAFELNPRKMTYLANCPPVGFSVVPRTRACTNPLFCPWCYVRCFLKPLTLQLYNAWARQHSDRLFVFTIPSDTVSQHNKSWCLPAHLCFKERKSPMHWFSASHFIQALDVQASVTSANPASFSKSKPYLACYLFCTSDVKAYAVEDKLKHKKVTLQRFQEFTLDNKPVLERVCEIVASVHQRNWYAMLNSQALYDCLLSIPKSNRIRTLRTSKRK